MTPLKSDTSRKGKIISIPVNLKPQDLRLLVAETVREVSKGVKLTEADVIVGGGYGVGSKENFQLIFDLAKCFENSAVSASRKVVDLGWIPYQHQVGKPAKPYVPNCTLPAVYPERFSTGSACLARA